MQEATTFGVTEGRAIRQHRHQHQNADRSRHTKTNTNNDFALSYLWVYFRFFLFLASVSAWRLCFDSCDARRRKKKKKCNRRGQTSREESSSAGTHHLIYKNLVAPKQATVSLATGFPLVRTASFGKKNAKEKKKINDKARRDYTRS